MQFVVCQYSACSKLSEKFADYSYACVFLCRDLAVDLRMKLGDWFRVVQLLKSGSAGGSLFLLITILFFYLCLLFLQE